MAAADELASLLARSQQQLPTQPQPQHLLHLQQQQQQQQQPQPQGFVPQQQQPQPPERLNQAVQQQLNLDSVRTRAHGLFKTISRIIEEFENAAAFGRPNNNPKWLDVLGQFSMVNFELFNIVEDIQKVSKAFVVHPKNVNAENSTVLPVMISSKLLLEMEAGDNAKREQLLLGMQNLPVTTQIEKLKARIDMIAAACESAEKIITDTRKAYGLGSRQGQTVFPVLDKMQVAKIHEQESLLRAATNFGDGLRLSGDQRHPPSILPAHLVDIVPSGDGVAHSTDAGVFHRNPSSMPSNSLNTQGNAVQASGASVIGKSIPSPSGAMSFDTSSTSPLPYANSPRSGTNILNASSPQQAAQHQQQRQKLGQLSQHQLLSQQFRQSSPGLGQNSGPQLHDMHGQMQQKVQAHGQHQAQFSQTLAQQSLQNKPLQSGLLQHNAAQSQPNQGNQLRSHLGQFSGSTASALFNTVQMSQNSQVIPNMSATMQSQSILPRMQFGTTGGHSQRNNASQLLGDQMFGVGNTNSSSMMSLQQQQLGMLSGYGGLPSSGQNLQPGIALQNVSQNQNFPQQQRQPPQT